MACNDHQVSPDRPRLPPSRRIADDLRRRLAEGEWPPGSQLPSNAELAEHYGSTRRTISRAMAVLAAEGLVEIEPRWGTFAAQRPPG
jgi:GntR family transcriptional regulator